ncbi:polysaccharide biosynthesis tyrosine autokinase [Rubripirellula amarantea]|uniref:non-specific protein-tyrosine kinase n=1 Tax=Rubripirellula amarantea TaxID=2527999 RepID=A0A5C5WDJ1_9BACT|nr:polysaccharide biosynthesis tyrosine autokinase [Rubripirellula amarantea]MDA8744860.1 polysaccharide biosynthesis tyrosine autokinase [Rubripirellula amarantea]TWT48161.1 Tyrosine-protein kinase YwqD [Rubripirellula amarantea]
MTESTKSFSFASGEIDPLGMIRRRWRLLVFGVFVGIALSALYYTTATQQYQSSIEVLVGQRSSEMTSRGTINGNSGSGESIRDDQLATHMRLFIARKVLTQAIELGDLTQYPSFAEIRQSGGSYVDHILDSIEVERGGDGNAQNAMVLRVTYRANDPEEAAMVLSSIYNSYKTYIDSQDQDKSKLAVELIDAARETHEKELRDADEDYRNYVASVPVLLEGDKVRDIHKERLADIEKELNDVRSGLAESKSRLEVIESTLERNGGTTGDMGHLALLSQKEVERLKFFLDMARGGAQSEAFQAAQPMRAEVAKAQYNRLLDLIQKEKALSDTFGPEHPLVEAAREETMITRQFIDANRPENTAREQKDMDPAEMVMTYVMLLKNDISEFEMRKAVLLSESQKEMLLAKEVEADFMKAGALRAIRSRAQSRYDQVIERLQELELSRSYAGFSTDLLASAEVPMNPVWPRLSIVLAIGLVNGAILGLILVVAAETLDSTFSSVEELEGTTGAAVIAHVPRMALRDLRKAANVKSMLDPSLMTFHSPRSPEAEIFRVGRTSMMIANRKGSVQTIMVTSPQPGDGKSTTISNMAISFAQTGKKVLLIDADMRRPVIAKLFGIDQEPGLSDYLERRIPFEGAVTRTEVANLDIVPNGGPTAEPAELLESVQLTRLLQEACAKYDLVLIDAPPVLAVADPAIIAPMVDSVLLTVRVIKNGRSIVEDAVRVLHDIQVEPTAVIVNGVDKNALRSYQYGGYGQNKYGYVGRYHHQYGSKPVTKDDSNTTTLEDTWENRLRHSDDLGSRLHHNIDRLNEIVKN